MNLTGHVDQVEHQHGVVVLGFFIRDVCGSSSGLARSTVRSFVWRHCCRDVVSSARSHSPRWSATLPELPELPSLPILKAAVGAYKVVPAHGIDLLHIHGTKAD